MAAPLSSLSIIPHHNPARPPPSTSTATAPSPAATISLAAAPGARNPWGASAAVPARRRRPLLAPAASSSGSRSDDSSSSSVPFEMSMESALKLLGVSEGASFDDILRAKNAVLASCKDDLEAVAQVEAAYDMLLMQSLSQRRAGKVANNSIRYADVKSARSAGTSDMPPWLQLRNLPVSVETPSTGNLGLQAGVYGALMVSTFVNGTSTSAQWTYTGPDVPGIILAISFGASLYFLSKKNIGLGKATAITMGGLVIGAVVGSTVENWLQMDKKKQKKTTSVEGHGDFGMDVPIGKGEEKKNRRERYNEDFTTDGQESEKTTNGKGELSSKESEGKERKRGNKKKKGKNADINNELEQDVSYNVGKVINGSKGKDEMPKSMKGKVTDEKNSHSSVETQRKEEEKSSHSCAETQRKKKKDKESNLCTLGPSEVDVEDGEFEGTKKSGVEDKERTNKKKKHRYDVKSAKGSCDGKSKTFDDENLAKSEKFRVSDDKIIQKKEKKKEGDCDSEFKETNKACVNDKDRKKKKRKHKDDNKPVPLVFKSPVEGSCDEGTKTFDNNDLTKGVGFRSSDDKMIKKEKRKKKKMDSDSGFQVAASNESDLCSDSKKKRKRNPVEGSCVEGTKTFDNDDLTKGVGFRGSDDKMIKKKEKRKKMKMKDSDSGFELAASNESDLCSDIKKKQKRKSGVDDSAMAPEKQKQKKKRVSFSGAVEVFPLDGDAENEEADDSENQEAEEQLIYGKRFTPEEDQKVMDAIDEYITKHQLGEEGIQMILKCKKYPQVKNCWKEIGACIPYRPRDAIYYRAHCLLERSELRKWTPEEYEEMHKFYKKHGADWRTLADKLGKHRFHVKDAWRRVKSPNFKKGNWSQDEYQSLFDLVNLDLRMKVDEEKDSKHGMLRDNIHWEAISDKLSTRYNAACCVKWYKQLTSPLVSEGVWADVDDYMLIDELKKTDACCIEDVDWENLLEHRSGELCRRRWDQMTRHLGSNREKPFIEQIEVLSKRYCPEMVEYRK